MSLQLNVSNSLTQLIEHLAINLSKPLPSVFQPNFIVTQTLGMNNWLKMQLADRLGITANCRFLKPNDLISHVYYLLNGPREHLLSADNLQWLLFGLLDEPAFKNKFPSVAKYYSDLEDLKRMALAEKIGDLFDQYQIYRPEMISEWNEISSFPSGDSNWQKYLWVETNKRIGGKMPDKTKISKFIVENIRNPSLQIKLKERIPHVNFFGISIITAYHLEVFHEIAKYIDISFHLLNPSPSIYWFEDKSPIQIARWKRKAKKEGSLYAAPIEGNTLLTNWGQVIQDTFGLFFKDDDFLNEYQDNGILPKPTNLLSKVQHDIYNNLIANERNKLSIDDLGDGSININACYTPVREIEALYNYLVALVDKHPHTISPRDIVVMVSDIETYAPYIKAIFKSAPYVFPFTIADESITSSNGVIGALHAFLELDTESFKAEDVLQLLEWDSIRTRFKITDTDLIRRVVDEANIRFGIDGNVEDDTNHVSWRNGLNRIMYGICMIGEYEYPLNNDRSFYPLDSVEGGQAFELIRFTHFIKVLIESIEGHRKDRTLVEWGDYILKITDNIIYQSEEAVDEDYQLLIDYVKKINLISDDIHEKISFSVFKHNFINSISGETRSGNFAWGGITFCSLIPMRSIPFKVIALLGLGFDKFPRKETPLNFNLMQQTKRKGDRNIKNNDKHLFLETILSAQEHLYISYIGKSTKDNSSLPPSAVVDELIDYIISGTDSSPNANEVDLRNKLITEHHLHNFNPQPNDIPNYITASVHGKVDEEQVPMSNYDINEVSLDQEVSIDSIIKFFNNPFEHYYNQVLNVYYRDEDILLRETEYFELDSLQKWKIKHDLLFVKNQDELQEYKNTGIKKGFLPLKNISETLLTSIYEEVTPIRQLINRYIEDREETSSPIEINVGEIKIHGVLNRIFGDKMVLVSFSKNNNKYFLETYIKHLLAIAGGLDVDSYLVSSYEECVYKLNKDAIDPVSATEKLAELLQCYQKGFERPFVFHPRFENDPDKLIKYDLKKFKAMLRTIFENYKAPCNDQYIINEYNIGLFDKEGVFEEYITNSALVISDAFRLLEKQ